MEKYDLLGKKTWLEKSWQDKAKYMVFPDCKVDLKTPTDDKIDLLISFFSFFFKFFLW
jgi:hypothetical protein